jgi:hypothetical protein
MATRPIKGVFRQSAVRARVASPDLGFIGKGCRKDRYSSQRPEVQQQRINGNVTSMGFAVKLMQNTTGPAYIVQSRVDGYNRYAAIVSMKTAYSGHLSSAARQPFNPQRVDLQNHAAKALAKLPVRDQESKAG